LLDCVLNTYFGLPPVFRIQSGMDKTDATVIYPNVFVKYISSVL